MDSRFLSLCRTKTISPISKEVTCHRYKRVLVWSVVGSLCPIGVPKSTALISVEQKQLNVSTQEKKNEAVERVCPTCGRTFTTTLSHKLYCSNECYLAHKSKEYVKKEGTERICPVCLKVFKTAHPHKKYCSYECYYKAHTARQDKEYIDARTDLPKSN